MSKLHRIGTMLALSLLAGGCGNSGAGVATGTTVDTLPGGAVHVRNTAMGLWDTRPETRWRVVEAVRIGRVEGAGPDVFGGIGSVALDDLGRIWLVDLLAGELRVFDGRGRHVRTVGRKGEGPGEFSRPGAMLLGPDGHIWVDDARLRRWEVFDTAGMRVAGHRGNSNIGGGIRVWSPDGRLLEVSVLRAPGEDPMEGRGAYAVRRLDTSGELVPGDTVPAPVVPRPEQVRFATPDGRSTIGRRLPLAHNPGLLLGADGTFWVTDGGGVYVIRRQSLEGDTLLIIERDYTPVAASEEVLRTAREQLVAPEGMSSSDNDPARIPSVHPPFDRYHVGTDGSLWVQRHIAGDSIALDVFDPHGLYLGEVETELDLGGLSVRLITPDRIVAVATDDLGVEYLLLLAIERPAAGDEG